MPARLRSFVSTVERTYYRLHGTTGSRHVHTDDEPRTGDAERFRTLLAR